MRNILLVFLFLSTVGDGLKKASRINVGVAEAGKLYRQQAYEQAIYQYRFLRDSLNVKDDALILNLAHATFQTGDLERARKYYRQLRNNPDADLQGTALNQLGIISFEDGNADKALYFFRNAIIKNPLNETARYNYELIKKYQAANPSGIPHRSSGRKGPAENQKAPEPAAGNGVSPASTGQTDFISDLNNPGTEPPQHRPQDQDGGAKDNLKKENPGNEQNKKPATADDDTPRDKGSQPGNTEGLRDEDVAGQSGISGNTSGSEEITEKEKQMQTLRSRLRNTNLSPEKALLLLEAMQNAELQYMQQVPRPPTRSRDKNKPDW